MDDPKVLQGNQHFGFRFNCCTTTISESEWTSRRLIAASSSLTPRPMTTEHGIVPFQLPIHQDNTSKKDAKICEIENLDRDRERNEGVHTPMATCWKSTSLKFFVQNDKFRVDFVDKKCEKKYFA